MYNQETSQAGKGPSTVKWDLLTLHFGDAKTYFYFTKSVMGGASTSVATYKHLQILHESNNQVLSGGDGIQREEYGCWNLRNLSFATF